MVPVYAIRGIGPELDDQRVARAARERRDVMHHLAALSTQGLERRTSVSAW